MKQAWCSDPKCNGGAKVGADCPPAMLSCVACGAPLTFDAPVGSMTDDEYLRTHPDPDVRAAHQCRCLTCMQLVESTLMGRPELDPATASHVDKR